MIEAEAKKTICPELSGPVAEPIDSDISFIMAWIDCQGSECQWWVQTDNEALPTLPGEEAEYEPAGHCGAVK